MKAFLLFLAVPVLWIATASADWVLEMKMESPQVNANTTVKVKGDKMRVDIPDGPLGATSSIVDNASGNVTQLIHSQKMAVTTSAAQLKMLMGGKDSGDSKNAPAPKPTGQKEKVGDYDCEIYTWTDGTNSARMWIASNHPQAAALKAIEKKMKSGSFGSMQAGPDASTLAGPAIKTEFTNQGQKVISTVLSVKEQDLDAKEFDAPAGYQSMAMPSLPGGK